VLLHLPTKLFLIPVISIRTTSVVSVMRLCNKLVPKRFHSQPRVLAEVRKTLFPRHHSGNARSISDRELKTPASKAQALGSCCSGLAVPRRSDALRLGDRDMAPSATTPGMLFSGLRLPRFCVVVRKLKIAPAGPVPLCDCHVVLINSLQQSAPGL
jgi:hypothetical protein